MRYRKKRYRKLAVGATLFLILSVLAPAVLAARPDMLVPIGKTVGIEIQCDGAMVIALNEIETSEGTIAPALDGGLQPGDVIVQLNDQEIQCSADFIDAVDDTAGAAVTVQVMRENNRMQMTLEPAETADGGYELGIWLRDGMAGIGTVTFYDPESGIFGALGHSINDLDTGIVMPLRSGTIMSAFVKSVIPGEAGMPGQLEGEFDLNTEIGTLFANTDAGIYGKFVDTSITTDTEAVPLADEDEIKLGAAVIMSNISGTEVAEYSVEISKIFSGDDTRNVMLTVTDERLLEKTGGIVQGMSGSPILQDGKLIGAVTHVLINNPIKGYGISIDGMVNEAYSPEENAAA